MNALKPSDVVIELDKYIIGQDKAKRAVAIALRNRWRRQMVKDDIREEIMPNNIILIGPTGVGKTEISRRLARLADLLARIVAATETDNFESRGEPPDRVQVVQGWYQFELGEVSGSTENDECAVFHVRAGVRCWYYEQRQSNTLA